MQAALSGLLVKLGRDHPYHVLYQLLSLQNGDRDAHGNADSLGSSRGGLQQNVDVDKIQAAALVIQQISQDPRRQVQPALRQSFCPAKQSLISVIA